MEDIIVPLLTFLFIVGSGVLKSINENKEKQQQNERKPAPVSRTSRRTSSQPQQTSQKSYQLAEESAKEQKTEQLDQLKKDLNVSSAKTMEHLEKSRKKTRSELDQLLVSRKKKQAMKKDQIKIKDYLTRKGLAGTVVMSEVLGEPRAKKPYRINRR